MVAIRLLCLTILLAACPTSDKAATKVGPAKATKSAKAQPTDQKAASPDEANELAAKVKQFAIAKLTADVSGLPKSERKALDELIEASKYLDPIFDRQAYAKNVELEQQLAKDKSPLGRSRYLYFRIMRGPWDRQNDFEPFATAIPRPKGGGYYPEDLTEDELSKWIAAHPDDKEALESLVTVVRREGDALIAVPYSKAYAEWLEPAAERLRAAADATQNASLKKFLQLRAAAFASDEYYDSDFAWMDLDSRVEITIGPYETYEDQLFAYKASFESFVTVSDPEASRKLDKFKKYLAAMEQHLPVPDAVKTKRGRESPIRVVDLVFAAGDARKSVQTIAFNLPNDELVRKKKGAKKVLLRNIIQTKFDVIMKPIGERVMDEKLHKNLSSNAFFNEVLFHELSHSLGPAYTDKDGERVEVRKALGSSYAALEECKADVMGAYNILFMIEKGEFPEAFRNDLLVSYFAGLFRSVRFGVSEAHGKGAAVQINRFLEDGAAELRATDGRFTLDLAKLATSIEKLVHDLVMIQHEGDKVEADVFLSKYGVMSDPMKHALETLGGIPVDIRPVYPLAGEKDPR